MDEILEDVGVDPLHTPTDNLPQHGAWALAAYFLELQGENPNE